MQSLFRNLISALAISGLAGCATATLPGYPIEHPANPQATMAPVTEPADSLTSSRRPDPPATDTSPTLEHRHEEQ